jgi:streptomycin 3"-adenylyltransferase
MGTGPDARVVEWSRALSNELATLEPGLAGAYLHGSGALGGFQAGRSDVDLLFVVAAPVERERLSCVAAALQRFPGCPGTGVEASILTVEQAADPASGAFELHATTGPGAKVVEGIGHPGDTDLVLHAVVTRAAGVALAGPPASTVFGAPPRDLILERQREELRWGLANASASYAVLNACRAALWAREERVASKVDAAGWALEAFPGWAGVVDAALAEHRGGAASARAAAERFVQVVLAELESAGLR